MEKAELRKRMIAFRDRLTGDEREEKSRLIVEQVVTSEIYIQAKVVCTYLHFRSEVQTSRLVERILQDDKTLCVPWVDTMQGELVFIPITDPEVELACGYMGIPEPIERVRMHSTCPEKIDLVVIPGAVFDKQGNRIGYGGGYYDRFLACHPDYYRLGLAFSMQIVPSLPAESHDMPMQSIICETNVFVAEPDLCGKQ